MLAGKIGTVIDLASRLPEQGFEQNCTSPCVLPQKEIAAFQLFIPDSRSGDTQTYADRMEVFSNGKRIGEVKGAGFTRLLLSTWIGPPAPPTEALKNALLGLAGSKR
ncbi:MAG: chalcone isomerase family protein [Pseudomonadota bacterium]|nr:chalcone isomerase family protein [Pseudomonadota bacterium]